MTSADWKALWKMSKQPVTPKADVEAADDARKAYWSTDLTKVDERYKEHDALPGLDCYEHTRGMTRNIKIPESCANRLMCDGETIDCGTHAIHLIMEQYWMIPIPAFFGKVFYSPACAQSVLSYPTSYLRVCPIGYEAHFPRYLWGSPPRWHKKRR